LTWTALRPRLGHFRRPRFVRRIRMPRLRG
jgi:hypothetical protein